MANTTNQGVPYVDLDDRRSSVPDTTKAMAEYIEKRMVMRFSSVTDRNSKLGTPEEGMLIFLTNTDELQVYSNGAWRTIWPTKPAITSGTAAPSGSASAGDIYIQY